MPAILKGYLDRVWVPGVAFAIVNGRAKPLLQHISRFAVVTTYGSPWWLNKLIIGDPNRRAFMRGIRPLVSPTAKTLWLAQHGMDYIYSETRERFLTAVSNRFRSW